jgi:hypothetical protein
MIYVHQITLLHSLAEDYGVVAVIMRSSKLSLCFSVGEVEPGPIWDPISVQWRSRVLKDFTDSAGTMLDGRTFQEFKTFD